MRDKIRGHDALTGKIIGCAMTVHSALGNGFLELIYQRALEIELVDAGMCCSCEHEMPVYYKGRKIGLRRVDILVEGVVCVELKARTELTDAHLAQARNYLEASDLKAGLLFNFGARSLEFKRMFNKKRNQRTQGNPAVPPSRQSKSSL